MSRRSNRLRLGRRLCLGVVAGVAAGVLGGCTSGDYLEVMDFPGEVWREEQAVVFDFQPLVSGTEAGAEGEVGGEDWIDICVRHREDFPLAELLLEVKGVRPDNLFWIDTIGIRLADPATDRPGEYRWRGRHYSNHYELTTRYRERIRYPMAGRYSVSIRQLCGLAGEGTLGGVLSIGLVAGGCLAAD